MNTETFICLRRQEEPDGCGGQIVTWTDGDAVQLLAVPCRTARRDTADRPAIARTMSLFGQTPMPFASRMRRERDGTVLRVLEGSYWEAPSGALWPLCGMLAEVVPA
ncbi:MAG: hypothetical protein IKP10_01765 [Clostridia bacterium]|nr:hypothetical protein [Clostridia bacterium]